MKTTEKEYLPAFAGKYDVAFKYALDAVRVQLGHR